MIYVAAPYNHKDPAVIQERMERVYEFIADGIKQGQHLVTPLSMHEVVIRHELPGTFDFWDNYCLDMLSRCDKMYVLQLPGWDTSRGVSAEIAFCETNGIEIEYWEFNE